jgi:hypothetical protein
VLALLQLLAALPWLAVLDPAAFRGALRKPAAWLVALVVCLGAGALVALFVGIIVQDPSRLLGWGKLYGAILNAQLVVDFFCIVFPLLLLVWPQGGAVALAAFREGVRQPMYWLITIIALGVLLVSPFLPYFTFGEDFKMVSELGFDIIMLSAVAFSVLAASMSISEEIEGRTAITLMSKPVSRRQFLLGKFFGILFAALLMTGMLGVVFDGVMWFKLWFDGELPGDPAWLEPVRAAWTSRLGEGGLNLALGAGLWFDYVLGTLAGLVFGFCQVMVLLAVAVALATRLPMVVNLVTCLVVFFLGHLTHVLVQVSAIGRYKLVNFMARFFENVLPGLEYFDIGPVIVRDVPPDASRFTFYIGSVVLYAVLYSIIALLFGLILFEDRDLA